MVRRQAVEGIEQQKRQMIAAMYSNPNWDEEKANRIGRIKEIEDAFERAKELVYNPDKYKEQEPDWNNPFWAAARRSYEKSWHTIEQMKKTGTMKQAVEVDEDQRRARERSLRDIDQLSLPSR